MSRQNATLVAVIALLVGGCGADPKQERAEMMEKNRRNTEAAQVASEDYYTARDNGESPAVLAEKARKAAEYFESIPAEKYEWLRLAEKHEDAAK